MSTRRACGRLESTRAGWTAREARRGWRERCDGPGGPAGRSGTRWRDGTGGTDGIGRTSRPDRRSRTRGSDGSAWTSRPLGRDTRDRRSGHVGRQRAAEHHGHGDSDMPGRQGRIGGRCTGDDDRAAKGAGAAHGVLPERRGYVDCYRSCRHLRTRRWPNDDGDGLRALQSVALFAFRPCSTRPRC